MSATLRQPRFIVPPDYPTHDNRAPWGTVRHELDQTSAAELQMLAGFRARFAAWPTLSPGQRQRLLRDIGIAALAHCGGHSHREIAAETGMSSTQVGAAIKSFAIDHGYGPSHQLHPGGQAPGGRPEDQGPTECREDPGH